MVLRKTDEEIRLENIFMPYLEKGRLREDAPQRAKDALERYNAIFEENYRKAFEDTYGWSYDR
nr:MAG TPA: hypothetical protein [Caudoviricetes sp.]DAS96374.1 MAG TPA: hypothetical protein [Caudoviricetes sp.]